MTFADQLWPSSELSSHCPFAPTQTSSHPCESHHAHMIFSPHPHLDILKPQLCSSSVLGVSALHYSTGSQEGFWTLASAHALHLTTFYLGLSISGAYWKF